MARLKFLVSGLLALTGGIFSELDKQNNYDTLRKDPAVQTYRNLEDSIYNSIGNMNVQQYIAQKDALLSNPETSQRIAEFNNFGDRNLIRSRIDMLLILGGLCAAAYSFINQPSRNKID